MEGIERVEELEAFVRLGVPLAQGFLLARPGPDWPTLAPEMAIRLRAVTDRARRVHQVAGLVEAVPSVPAGDRAEAGTAADRAVRAADPGLDLVAVVDDAGTPLHLVRPALRHDDPAHAVQVVPVSLEVRPDADLVEAATRAMTRVAAHRFDPVLCVDVTGRLLGLVRLERVTLRLAELHDPASGHRHHRAGDCTRGRAVKEFDCADVVPGCGARFRAGSGEELVAAVHASIRDV